MPTRRLTVSVPKPCREDWNVMTPELQGRFCQSCSKTVVDFTAMSDAEVVNWMTKQKGSSCGRFTEKQLGRELVYVSAGRNRWTWKAAVLGLSAWLSAKTVEGKGISYQQQEQLENQFAATVNLLPIIQKTVSPPDSSLTISGKVLDATTGKPIAGASVVVKGRTIGTPTNSSGTFILDIPASVPTESTSIVISYIGFVSKEVTLKQLQTQPSTIIRMTVDSTPLMGETFIIAYKWYSPRGLFYKAKNLFR